MNEFRPANRMGSFLTFYPQFVRMQINIVAADMIAVNVIRF